MTESEITLSDIATCLANLRKRRDFEPRVEAYYEAQNADHRSRLLIYVILRSTLVYNALLLMDYLILPKTFWWAAALHFGLVTSVVVATVLAIRGRPTRVLRETLTVLIIVLIFIQVMAIYVMNKGPTADNYQYMSILAVILMNTTQRADYRFAFPTSLALATVYLLIIWGVGQSPLPTQLIGTVMMCTSVFATLTARRLMERDSRYAFLRRAQDKLQRDAVEATARRDELTGLYNRRHLDEQVVQLWSSPDDVISPVAVLMIDIDNFKALNDQYGHLAGDMCLTRVASAIVGRLSQKDDIAVRFGGEEFLVVLNRTDLMTGVRVAERIRLAVEALAIPNACSPHGGVVTASIGVMAGPVAVRSFAELIADADVSLYVAKRSGRNMVQPPMPKADSGVTARARAS